MFELCCDADPAIELVSSDAGATPDVAVTDVAAAGDAAVPFLRVRSGDPSDHAFLIRGPESELSDLRGVVRELGLDRIDATELATETGAPITVGYAVAATRAIEVRRAVARRKPDAADDGPAPFVLHARLLLSTLHPPFARQKLWLRSFLDAVSRAVWTNSLASIFP